MSFPRYPKYKKSGVEWLSEVPATWQVMPCRAIVTNVQDTNEGAADQNYLSLMANVGIIPYEDKGDIGNKKPDDLTKCKVVKKGNLVINSMNYSIGSYGMSEYDGVCSPVYVVLAINPATLLPRFALRIFENQIFQKYIASFGNGILAHRAAIGWQDIKGVGVAIPPKDAQQTILTFLDLETARMDALVAEQQRLVELLIEKRQTVISHTLTKGLNPDAPTKPSGVDWLGDVPAHWEVFRVKQLAEKISKGTTPTTIGAEFTSSGVRFIKAENIGDGKVVREPEFYVSEHTHSVMKRSALQDGDVLVVIAGATTGKSAVLPASLLPANTNQAVSFIRPKERRMSTYISLWLGTGPVRSLVSRNAVQSAQPNLSMEDLGNIPVPVPPVQEIMDILAFLDRETSKLEGLIDASKQAINLLQERGTAVISAAVMGKIDVRRLVDAETA